MDNRKTFRRAYFYLRASWIALGLDDIADDAAREDLDEMVLRARERNPNASTLTLAAGVARLARKEMQACQRCKRYGRV